MSQTAALLFMVGSALLIGAVSYKFGYNESRFAAKYCSDCGDEREQDGLCHDCRARLWGEVTR